MNDDKLTDEERQLLAEVDRGEWVSDLTPERRSQIRAAAEQTLRQDQRVSVSISVHDLAALQRKALQEGLSSETLIASILHKYVSGTLVEPKAP